VHKWQVNTHKHRNKCRLWKVGIVAKFELYNLDIIVLSVYVIYTSYLDMFDKQRMIANVWMKIQIIYVLGKVNISDVGRYIWCMGHASYM
jgi:hypothetical protein